MNYHNLRKISRIVLATDNSPSVSAAEKFALDLSQFYHCHLTIVHVFEDTYDEIPKNIAYDEYIDQLINQKLAELENKFGNAVRPAGVSCEYDLVVRKGTVAETITQYAIQAGADYLVLGTHGSSGFRNNAFGSVTLGVINSSTIPVFAIPTEAAFNNLKNITLACKGNDSEIPLVKWLVHSLDKSQAGITLLHVASEDNSHDLETFVQRLNKMLGWTKLDVTHVDDPDIEKGLNDFVTGNNVNLLVLFGRPKSFFRKLYTANLIKRMVYHTSLPLLYIPPEDSIRK
ncbi:MAG TPA: universal stress protein [Cyclobacteriaceae bacterium]|nr:universal stress protein [Cyclobacteriaceae bacterium]